MSQLYTVRMFRELRVCSYDPHTGHRVNERTEKLEVVVTDLPMRTALAYQFKFPNNDVKLEAQDGAAVDLRHVPTNRDYYEQDDAPVEKVVAIDRTVEAAIAGDLSAALDAA